MGMSKIFIESPEESWKWIIRKKCQAAADELSERLRGNPRAESAVHIMASVDIMIDQSEDLAYELIAWFKTHIHDQFEAKGWHLSYEELHREIFENCKPSHLRIEGFRIFGRASEESEAAIAASVSKARGLSEESSRRIGIATTPLYKNILTHEQIEVIRFANDIIACSYNPDPGFSDDFWFYEGGEPRSEDDRARLLEAANDLMDELATRAGIDGGFALEHQSLDPGTLGLDLSIYESTE